MVAIAERLVHRSSEHSDRHITLKAETQHGILKRLASLDGIKLKNPLGEREVRFFTPDSVYLFSEVDGQENHFAIDENGHQTQDVIPAKDFYEASYGAINVRGRLSGAYEFSEPQELPDGRIVRTAIHASRLAHFAHLDFVAMHYFKDMEHYERGERSHVSWFARRATPKEEEAFEEQTRPQTPSFDSGRSIFGKPKPINQMLDEGY